MLEALASTVSRVRAPSNILDRSVSVNMKLLICLSVCHVLLSPPPPRILQHIPTSSRMILTSLPGPPVSLYVKNTIYTAITLLRCLLNSHVSHLACILAFIWPTGLLYLEVLYFNLVLAFSIFKDLKIFLF